MKYFFLLFAGLALFPRVEATDFSFLGAFGEKKPVIVVHNRVLAKVNGKPITVVDLMRKLDMLFFQRYAEYADVKEARCQFYQAAWRHVLDELIDKELMLLEAKELKMDVNNGEVRKEMERLFGPNVVANLDSIGMTYDEAWESIHGDMVIQRVMYLKVNVKAQKQVTPKEVRTAYEAYITENKQPSRWIYRIISIRDTDPVLGASSANRIQEALNQGETLEALPTKIESLIGISPTSKITFSDASIQTEAELSEAYRNALSPLKPGEFSIPIAQKSRVDNATVFRIFALVDRVEAEMPTLAALEGKLRQELVRKAMDAETLTYLTNLRKKHALNDDLLKTWLPEEFVPFVLK